MFNFLSARNVSLNVKTVAADFGWSHRLVHGTKLAEAFMTMGCMSMGYMSIGCMATGHMATGCMATGYMPTRPRRS